MISPLRIVGVPLLFLVGVLATSLLVAATVLAVPTSDIPRLALALLGTGVVVELCAILLTRPVVLRRVGSVREQLVGASLTGGLLLLGMVVAGALAMFIQFHDLSILLTMVLFAALLAIGLGVRGAAPLAQRIERIREGTTQLASGEFGTRLPVDGLISLRAEPRGEVV